MLNGMTALAPAQIGNKMHRRRTVELQGNSARAWVPTELMYLCIAPDQPPFMLPCESA
jgi:hypothetical protein